jgi:hypothetical protein
MELHIKYPLLYLSDFMETAVSSTDFGKCSNMKFHENLSSGAGLFYAVGRTDRRMDIHNEANSLFSKFFQST